MAANLSSASADYSASPLRVALPDSLGSASCVLHLGVDASHSTRNLASRTALAASAIGSIAYGSNYAHLQGVLAAYLDLLFPPTAAITYAVVGRAITADQTATASRPVFVGNLGVSAGQGIATNFGDDITVNGAGTPPAANLGFLDYNGTAPTPGSNGYALALAPDITETRMIVATRDPGVQKTYWDVTAGLSQTVSLVGKTTAVNSSTLLVGSDRGGTRAGQCQINAVYVFPRTFTGAMKDTLVAFLRANLARRGVTGF